MATTWRQDTFRFRNDDGSETTATWIANAGTNATVVVGSGNYPFRVRIEASEQGTTAAALTPYLFYQKNGTGGYVQTTTTANNGCQVYPSANVTDNTATTQQISAVTYVAGTQDDGDGKCGATGSIARYSGSEHEYSLLLVFANLTEGDYFDFREYSTTNAFGTYTLTGRITIHKNWNLVVSDLSQAQTIDDVAVSEVFDLAPSNLAQAVSIESTTLGLSTSLAVADLSQAQTTENVPITQTHNFTISDLVQSQTIESITLGSIANITISDLYQAVALDGVTVGAIASLTIDDLAQVITIEGIIISAVATLTIGDFTQTSNIDGATISVEASLLIGDLSQNQTLDNVIVSIVAPIDLAVSGLSQVNNFNSTTLVIFYVTTHHDITVSAYDRSNKIDSESRKTSIESSSRSVIIIKNTTYLIPIETRIYEVEHE